ncbi:MAG: hypothetical protein AB7U45_09320 [Desulfamplus sp.]
MKKLSDIVSFNEELFFNGAVKIGWFESDKEKSHIAASHFVFHGPEYHGVRNDDYYAAQKYALIDTATFTHEIITNLSLESNKQNPFALAIAGYGTGKSHLGLTLSMLCSAPHSETSNIILNNLEQADISIGASIRSRFNQLDYPFLVIAINGMDDFDLSAEITRQVLLQLKNYNCDTTIIEELSPRFSMASNFVKRNFDLRQKEFFDLFGADITSDKLCDFLSLRNERTYSLVNEIFENANGYPIRAIGQESLQHLISTVTENYCGKQGPFESLLIVFDEFGRYLEFASEKPHIAGDSALQQLFEGVQENASKCFLLCFIQYELKAYISRVSHEKKDIIKRYIGRYDSAKKYLLSTNLETLFAHLIHKNDINFISEYLSTKGAEDDANIIYQQLNKWLPNINNHSVWSDHSLFQKVIYKGCWPLHPIATWFLCRLADTENELQQRSALSFINEIYQQENNKPLGLTATPWTVSAAKLCSGALIEEMLSSEQAGNKSTLANAYATIEQKYKHDLTLENKYVLLSILINTKIGIKVENREEANIVLSKIAGISQNSLNNDIEVLSSDFGVIEWNDRFKRYELLSDSVPRSAFTAFLRNKTNHVSLEQVEELFALHIKKWGELNDLDSDFASHNNITTIEWRFQLTCSHIGRIESSIKDAIKTWQDSIETDSYRGQIIYCYVSPEREIAQTRAYVQGYLKKQLQLVGFDSKIPIMIVLLHDSDAKLKQALSEYWVLTSTITDEENEKFAHFIKNHCGYLFDEFKRIIENLLRQKEYIYSEKYIIENFRLKKITYDLFDQTYSKILPFPFDGFSTTRGNAAKDCREITSALIQGQLNHDWISTKPAQIRNRVTTLLSKKRQSWGGLGDDGYIALLPENTNVRFIILEIEKKLKSQGSVNIGEIFNTIINPPFGCNIASAGLIISLFLAPRQDNTAIIYNNEKMNLSAWVGIVFKGNFFDIKVLNKSEIRFISETEASEWQRFLEEWDNESTHVNRVEFMQRAIELNQRIPRPGHLYDRWYRLDSESEDSSKKIDEFNKLIDYQEEAVMKAQDKEDVPSLSWSSRKLDDYYNSMKANEIKWTHEQFEKIEHIIRMAKTALVQYFDSWLPQQKVFSSQQIGDFRHKMLENIDRTLNTLGLTEQSKQLKSHVNKVIGNIEELQQVKYIIEESEAFIKSHNVNVQSKIVEMNNWVKSCDELLKTLEKSKKKYDASEIKKVIQKISDFQKKCWKQINEHKDRAAALYNIEFATLDDVNKASTEIQNILYLFDGQQSDIADFDIMQRQLSIFKNDISSWMDETVSNKELEEKVKKRIIETDKELNEYDEPVWDTNTTYHSVLNNILKHRRLRAEEWIRDVYVKEDAIKKMSAEKIQMLLNKLKFVPAYLDDQQSNTINIFQKILENRIEEMQIEGLVAKFKQMSKEMQMQFFALIQKMINSK